jgi:hypothetical protein
MALSFVVANLGQGPIQFQFAMISRLAFRAGEQKMAAVDNHYPRMMGPRQNFARAGKYFFLAGMLALAACRPSSGPVTPPAVSPAAPPAVGAELIINGSFEKPLTPQDGYPVGKAPPAPQSSGGSTHILALGANTAPPDFGWTIEAGKVGLMGYGYDSGGGNVLLGPMAQGVQCLQLNGRNPGPLSQTFATEVGGVYSLTFAYANNPDPDASPSCPFEGEVAVVDTASGKDLAPPLDFTHTNSTLSDYHWVQAGPITFTATGGQTTIRFKSLDGPSYIWGVFVDDVSVQVVSRPGPFEKIGRVLQSWLQHGS